MIYKYITKNYFTSSVVIETPIIENTNLSKDTITPTIELSEKKPDDVMLKDIMNILQEFEKK